MRCNSLIAWGALMLSCAGHVLLVPNAKAQEGDDIVVLGQSLPLPPGNSAYGSVMIDRDRLTGNAANRIETILADVAGFQQFRRSDSRSANPSAQGATLRALGGNASSRTLVLLDGVPMADPFFGYIPFSALVPDRLSAVRVTRGGGSGAFGAGAVAGTIELASAARDDLADLYASAFYGSRHASEVSGAVTQDLGSGFVSLSGRWDRGDGFHTTPKSQRVAATTSAAYAGWSVNLRAVAPLSSDMEVQFRSLLFRDDRTLRIAGADSHSEGQDTSIRLMARGRWQVDALAYVQARNFSNIVISASTYRKSLDQRNTPSTGLGGKIELRPPVGRAHVLRLGIDTRLADGMMAEEAYNANLAANPVTARRRAGGQQITTGLFMEDDWTLGSLILTGGIRADRWTIRRSFFDSSNAAGVVTGSSDFARRSDWQVSGRAGALFRIDQDFALRAAAYTGFRLPTLNELYRPFVVFPITTQANAALLPERLKGVDAGLDINPAADATLGLTLFYNRLDDAIANVTIAPNLRQRRNVSAVIAKGVELTGRARLHDALRLSGSYAYSNSIVRAPGLAFDGFAPAQSPRHAASATLGWQPTTGPSLSATLRYVAKQYEDDLQGDVLPDALTIDAFADLPIGHGLSLVARAENLFDATMVTRNVAGSMDLGTPRTLWIGLRFIH